MSMKSDTRVRLVVAVVGAALFAGLASVGAAAPIRYRASVTVDELGGDTSFIPASIQLGTQYDVFISWDPATAINLPPTSSTSGRKFPASSIGLSMGRP